ncbi:MAG: M20/M25/M40 family metallo-hydrolase [Thermoanaerobaculia bacterium]
MTMQRVGILVMPILLIGASLTVAVAADGGDLRAHIEKLASDEWRGRMTGSEGAVATAEYLVEELEALGAEPLPGEGDFVLEFEFTAGTNDTGSSITLSGASAEEAEPAGAESFAGTGLVQALSFSEDGSVTGPAIFAGYGMVVPDDGEFSYDSYGAIDVEGKIVVALRYFPEDAEDEPRARLARFSGLRYKAMQARERGALAIVIVTGPRSPNAGEVVPMAFDAAVADSGLLAVSANHEVAERLLAYGSDKSVEDIQKSFDDANPHVVGFDLDGLELTVKASVQREKKIGRNVVGILPRAAGSGSNGENDTWDKPYVLVGAHFDHLGKGRTAGSLADKSEADAIHYGADDNASGVAAVLSVASSLAERDTGREIVIAFWSGEEIGILGSGEFAKGETLSPDKLAAYINFDMVGRSKDNKLSLQAVGSSRVWPGLIEQSNVPVGLDLSIQDDPYLPTDSTSFNTAKVPTLNFFTGSHEDYHKPSDTAEKINYEDLERIAKLGTLITRKVSRLDTAPEFVTVERKVEEGGGRDGVRAFTGTIPDYGTEVEGLLLSGVIEGGPADEAGLQAGDVIVQFGAKEISNIYDYTYALDAVKIGEPIEVVFVRDGEEKETSITPRARD